MCCAIAGGFNVPVETIGKMLTLQGSRGPDFIGISPPGASTEVIFGHNRLAIIDKSEAGNQPMSSTIGDLLTYNGEIYNADIDDFYTTDSKWLLYGLPGPDGPELIQLLNNLNGMFAFAYHNEATHKITLVRDRFGIKPLYYTHQKDFFAFASTPAAVALTKSNWDISEKGLHEYLALGATTLHSMFHGIEAVPPGHYVVFDIKTNTIQVKRWYYPKFIENAYETIQEKVIQAIDRVKLTCDWPQIILLSGGIDSTLVASRYAGQKAIHLASPEQEYAQKVADRFGIQMFNVTPQAQNAEECLTDYITKSGDPTMAGLIPYITCKEIKKLGYRVAITANGADELFWGYDRTRDYMTMKKAIFRDFSFTDQIIKEFWDNLNIYPEANHNQWLEIYSYLMFDLNKTLDFASMCHSVEVRVPYLDHELVESALSIPQEKHVANFGNKTILKKMLVDLGFDFGFIHRPKVGFSLHETPGDWQDLQNKSMKWYSQSGYEQLCPDATPRQESYMNASVVSLYLWMRVFKGL